MEDKIVGLDIGTTKVCAVIGERNSRDVIEITGVGTSPSAGMRKGVVVNIESTIDAITKAVEAAETMSDREVRCCWTGIGGSHVKGINTRGVVAISGQKRGENREVSRLDIVRVLESARAEVIPLDRQIIQTIPQSYIVDHQKVIKDPLGMIGIRLELEACLITVSVTSMKNLVRCVNRAGFEAIPPLQLQVLAAGSAVLTPQEQELGVALIDLGGGTTDVVVYYDGAPYYTFTVPVGGCEVTKDISMIKGISIETAEKIKLENACCWEPQLEEGDIFVPDDMTGRSPMAIPRSHIYAIVKPRMEEIFELVKQELECINLPRPLTGGVVITGGAAALTGTVELAGEVFRMPVRLGVPIRFKNLGGLVDEYCTPSYATAIGLVLEGDRREKDELAERDGTLPIGPRKEQGFLRKVGEFFKNGLF